MFRKNLHDVVKGIRANKNNEDAFIRSCLAEISNELRSNDIKVKAQAVNKAVYLRMIGHPVNCCFNIIEVVSRPEFHYKRLGYLAAAHFFDQDTKEIMLITQTMRNDMGGRNMYVTGTALNALANIVTPQLSQDLTSEVLNLLNSQQPYVKKKALLVLFKCFLKYPESLRPAFPRIKEKLKDSHQAVTSSAVNLICELSKKNPNNYKKMAPLFYKLLKTLKNNWTLIKIIKLFNELIPHEPRLPKKLKEPIITLINCTSSKSLLYECLFLATKGMQKHRDVVKLAVDKLKTFVKDPDQNLKYLGLVGLNNLMNRYPKVISDMKEEILECLHDKDSSIRQRAVDLLCGVINKKNVRGIVKKLLKATEASDNDDRNFVVKRILESCSNDNYSPITNFHWYLDILIRFTEMNGIEHGKEIAHQIMDILIRVGEFAVREFGVELLLDLLKSEIFSNEGGSNASVHEVLYAASYCIGEFIDFYNGNLIEVIEILLDEKNISVMPDHILPTFIQSALKVYARFCAGGEKVEIKNLLEINENTEEKEETPEEKNSEEEEEKEGNVGLDNFFSGNAEPVKKKSIEEDILDQFAPKKEVAFEIPKTEVKEQEVKEKIILEEPKKTQKVRTVKVGELKEVRDLLRKKFESIMNNGGIETKERICSFLSLLDLQEERLQQGEDIGLEVKSLFSEQLYPVVEGAVDGVKIPEGLDLDEWIGEKFEPNFQVEDFSFEEYDKGEELPYGDYNEPLPGVGVSPELLEGHYESQKDLFILKGAHGVKQKNITDILEKPGQKRKRGRGRRRGTRGKRRGNPRGRRKRRRPTTQIGEVVVSTQFERPEGFEEKDLNVKKKIEDEQDDLSKIDLTKPITEEKDFFKVKSYPKKSVVTDYKSPEELKRIQDQKNEEERKKRLKRRVRGDPKKRTSRGRKVRGRRIRGRGTSRGRPRGTSRGRPVRGRGRPTRGRGRPTRGRGSARTKEKGESQDMNWFNSLGDLEN